VRIEARRIELRSGDARFEAEAPFVFGHLGCRTLRSWAGAPKDAELRAARRAFARERVGEEVLVACGREKATERLGRTLAEGLAGRGLAGVDLWDTMRTGSDYWRPGGLLTQAAASRGLDVRYLRRDDLCPEPELLARFRRSGMPFAHYAAEYGASLEAEGGRRLQLAVEAIVRAQAEGRVAVFYCTDPHLPGYAPADQLCSDLPLEERAWCPDPLVREEGCHRVVLADRIGRWLLERGLDLELLEFDVTRALTRSRRRPR